MALKDVEFFGTEDRRLGRKDEPIVSEYPSWYFKVAMEELKESIDRKKRALESGNIPRSEIPYAEEELKRESKKMKQIISSVPKLNGADKDSMAKIYKKLKSAIGESLFTSYQMKKGLADAHEEARRMIEPIIDFKEEAEVMIASKMGITPREGRISRNEASRVFKIIGRLIDEPSNVEVLRREGFGGVRQAEVPLEEMR
jgi:tellurite resistance protein